MNNTTDTTTDITVCGACAKRTYAYQTLVRTRTGAIDHLSCHPTARTKPSLIGHDIGCAVASGLACDCGRR